MEQRVEKPDSPMSALVNILFNIVIPVWVLKNLSSYGGANGPLIALVVALCFPASYFLYEYIKLKKRNWISILGFSNTLLTGGFAVLQLEGIWFAVKEASFPLLIGIFVLFSANLGKKTLVELMFLNPSILKVDLLNSKLQEFGKEVDFKLHMLKTNKYLSYSFFLSAILNFGLAYIIFKKIPLDLSDLERSQILNEQISDMTWKSYIVIMIPSMLCLALIFRFLSKGIHQMTGLKLQDLVQTH